MRRIALLGASSLALLIVSIAPSAADAAFSQCPSVDKNSGCQFLITVGASGVKVEEDVLQGPFEGSDDALVGIQNNSSKAISSIPLSAENELFGFESDGICSVEKPAPGCVVLPKNEANESTGTRSGKPCPPEVANCGFLPPSGEPANVTFEAGISIVGFAANGDAVTGYEGPTSWFTNITPSSHSGGVVNFSPALAPGASTYFSLESPPTGKLITVGGASTLSTSLSGGGQSGPSISVIQGTPVADTATLGGSGAAVAEGSASYAVYSDPACAKAVAAAGAGVFSHGVAAASTAVNLAPGKYYWQATYGGDLNNQPAVSACGSEVLTVLAATTISTVQSGAKLSGPLLTVPVGKPVTDKASIAGALGSTSTGTVSYVLYKDSKCAVPLAAGSAAAVINGVAGPSAAVTPKAGLYYWKASYSGDAANAPSTSACGSEVLLVALKASLGLPSGKVCLSKRRFAIHPRAPHGAKLVSFEEQINGVTVKKGRLSRRQTSVNLIGLPKGTFEIELITRSSKGKTYEDFRTFHTCVPKKHKKHK